METTIATSQHFLDDEPEADANQEAGQGEDQGEKDGKGISLDAEG